MSSSNPNLIEQYIEGLNQVKYPDTERIELLLQHTKRLAALHFFDHPIYIYQLETLKFYDEKGLKLKEKKWRAKTTELLGILYCMRESTLIKKRNKFIGFINKIFIPMGKLIQLFSNCL